jgi:hypothetical protein
MNLCRSCGHDFAGVSAFDRHRIGTHDYTYAEGLRMEPLREDGRRCMSTDEMADAGMELNDSGRWFLIAAADRAHERFAEAA